MKLPSPPSSNNGLYWRIFRKHRLAFSMCEARPSRASAPVKPRWRPGPGMEKGFAGAGKPGDQGLDRAAVTAVGGIDHAVAGVSLRLHQQRVIERADNRLNAMRSHRRRLGLVTNQPTNPVP